MTGLRSTPTLILTGAQDIIVHTRHSDDLLAHLPQAHLHRFADAGHGVPLQHAAAVNLLLRDHIRGASYPRSAIHE
jgi:pimeloyl-ACP methyl ester carboxylesterase